MALEQSEYVVLSEGNAHKRGKESWAAMLRRWLVKCPRCSEVWLVIGAREKEGHICKDCGHSFIIRLTDAPKDSQSNSALGESYHK